MKFRLQDANTIEEQPQISETHTFEAVRNASGDKTFCLLDWLLGCDPDNNTCRGDGNCGEHDRRSPCNRYDISKCSKCRCEKYDSHGY